MAAEGASEVAGAAVAGGGRAAAAANDTVHCGRRRCNTAEIGGVGYVATMVVGGDWCRAEDCECARTSMDVITI